MKWMTRGVSGMVLATLCTGCATALTTPVPGADQLRVTKNAADVIGCTPVGNVDGHLAGINYPDAIVQIHNQTIGLGGDTLFMTYDPADHIIGPADRFVTGVAYRCAKAATP